jgi:hypothetical protein
MSPKAIHEAGLIRDAETVSPGIVKKTIEAARPARSLRSGAAFRTGKIGPLEAERFAHLANRLRVEFVVRTD